MSQPQSISSIATNIVDRTYIFENQENQAGYGNVYVGSNCADIVSNYTDESVILAEDGDNTIISAGNNNTIVTGQGADQVVAIGNQNYISVGSGDDKVYYQGKNSTIFGRAGNDYIVFSGKNNNVSGGSGNDAIYTATLNILAQNGQLFFGDVENMQSYSYDIDGEEEQETQKTNSTDKSSLSKEEINNRLSELQNEIEALEEIAKEDPNISLENDATYLALIAQYNEYKQMLNS